MMRLLLFFLLVSQMSIGQSDLGSIKGTVIDEDGQGVPFVRVVVYFPGQDEAIQAGAQTDFDGNFYLNSIPAGLYDIVIDGEVEGLDSARLSGVEVLSDQITFIDQVEMTYQDVICCCFGFVPLQKSLRTLEMDPFGRSITIKKEDIRRP